MAELSPRFIDGPALTIAGIADRYTPSTLGQLLKQWAELRGQLALFTGRVGGDAYGVWFNVLKGAGEFTYVAGVPVGEFAPVNPSFHRIRIIPARYAVFAHNGPAEQIRGIMDAILNQWLPKSGYEVAKADADAPDFIERYSEQYNDTGQGPIEIWLPVKKK